MSKSGTKLGPVDLSSDINPLLEASTEPTVVQKLGPVDLGSDVHPLLEASSGQEWY